MLYRRLSLLPLALALLAPACGPKQTTPPTKPAATEPEKAPVAPIPAGFFTLTPQITVQGVDAAVDFYVAALGAEKVLALAGPDGKSVHAEIRVGDSIVMIDEENVEQGMKSPLTLGGTPATLVVFVDDADAVFATAVGAGAKAEMPIEEQFWGDRYGTLIDPAGHRWALATHVEDLTPEQMGQRAELAAQAAAKKKPKKKSKKPPAPPEWKLIVGTPATDPTPANYHTVTIALTASDAAAAIAFYKAAFGATDRDAPMTGPDGKIMHAELTFGDSTLMLSDELPAMGGKSPTTLGGSPVGVVMYTPDVDAAFAQATGAGGTAAMPVTAMFWGDRYGAVVDPAGYTWGVATHVEDVTPEQMQERMAAQPAPAADAAATPAADAAAADPAADPAAAPAG
jgi:PhnB protein